MRSEPGGEYLKATTGPEDLGLRRAIERLQALRNRLEGADMRLHGDKVGRGNKER